MGYRLSKIYTKTGDQGTTGLGDGSRVPKNDPRIECYGEIDELNSLIGLLATCSAQDEEHEMLLEIQHDLFDLGGELSIPGQSILQEVRVRFLENWLDKLNRNLDPLEEFILPGGTQTAAICHVARTVCRRAERRLVSLNRVTQINQTALIYLNRLSDLLFVLARSINLKAGTKDVLWNRNRSPAGSD